VDDHLTKQTLSIWAVRQIQILSFGPMFPVKIDFLRWEVDRSNAMAQCEYADRLMKDGVGPGAARYLKLAVDQGFAVGQYHDGLCLLNGEGVSINRCEASTYSKLAADQGIAAAQQRGCPTRV
jgi:TPR repeat protein